MRLSNEKAWTSRRVDRAVVVLVAVHLAIALWLGSWLSVWQDEGFTLDTTGAGPLHALHQALSFEMQPPLYFVLLSIWRLADSSYWFARAFSALCTAAALLLTPRLAGWIPNARIRLALVAWLAVHPFVLWHGSDARVYGLVLFEAAAAMLLFDRAFLRPASSRAAHIGMIAVMACGIYTHYYFGFLIPALGTVLLLRDRGRLLSFLADTGLVAVFCLPLVFVVPSQIAAGHALASERAGIFQATTELWWKLGSYVLPASPSMLAFSWLARTRDIVWKVLALGTAFVLIRRRFYRQEGSGRLLLVTAVLLIEFIILRFATPPELFASRHTTMLFIPLLATSVVLGAGAHARLSRILLAFLLSMSVMASWTQFSSGAKSGEDWRRVARFLETHENRGEPVLVCHGDRVLALRQHYHGINALVPFPRPLRLDEGWLENAAIHDEREVDQAFDEYCPQGRAWLLTAGQRVYLGVKSGDEILADWVTKRCIIHLDEHAGGARIRLLERQPPATQIPRHSLPETVPAR